MFPSKTIIPKWMMSTKLSLVLESHCCLFNCINSFNSLKAMLKKELIEHVNNSSDIGSIPTGNKEGVVNWCMG